jgi:cellulose synthase (UDP-forming)
LSVDQLPLSYVWAPLALVVAVIYLIAPVLPMKETWARRLVFAAVWLVVLRYLAWRLFETVLPASGSAMQLAWIWLCFSIELMALGDALILYLGFLRTTDRRAEADRHEVRMRAVPPERLPSVDVYIPTYNEPLDVVEKSIVGALSLDYPNLAVWVLDDGRRPWLKEFCAAKGVGYITRGSNAHAKAGNINHALRQTDAEFVAIFDADFIPQRDFLMRTMGFFEDPKVGIVQVPHAFYNHDPMQANLALRKSLPDDQRFFFEAIMPSRDGWDAAFCCGSNSVTRRAAMRAVGDALPTDSITEDMLLSLVLLRQGYVTRYLCERLAFGLAPESITAFFVQRQRWARGAIQMLYLPEGPLGRDLRFMHRLMFLPTHWLTQSLTLLMSILAPLVFLWTGLAPLVNVTLESVVHYLVPMMLAIVGGITAFAPGLYFPLAAQVLGTFQSFKLLPTVLQTMVQPRGHLFKVTPKGSDAAGAGYESGIFWTTFGLMLLTLFGLAINTMPDWHIVEQMSLLPMVAIWGAINIGVLFLVCMMCLQAPIRRGEERFEVDEPVWLRDAGGSLTIGRVMNVSLSGAGIALDVAPDRAIMPGDQMRLFLKGVGFLTGTVARAGGSFLGLHFDLPSSVERDLLIRKIFTSGLDTTAVTVSAWSATFGMLRRIWTVRTTVKNEVAAAARIAPPEKLPAETFVAPPRLPDHRLADLAEKRSTLAA